MQSQTRKTNVALLRILLVSLLTIMILTNSEQAGFAAAGDIFNDLETATTALPYIQYLSDKGVINGFPDGSFRPWAAVTRAQLVKILVLALDLKLVATYKQTFPDVPEQYWAYPYIESAAAAGLISGYPDGSFQPEAVVTRAEQASMLFSFARYPVADVPQVDLDDVQPGHWAYAAIAAAIDAGLMGPSEGKSFLPNGASSRVGVARNSSLLTTMLPQNQVGILQAILTPLNGQVTVIGQNGTQQVKNEITIGSGDRIITGSNSSAQIEFDDGTGLRLESATEIQIIQGLGSEFIAADGKPGKAINLLELKLIKGRMVGALATRAPVVAAPPQKTASLIERVRRVPGYPILLAATSSVPVDEDWWQQQQPLYLPPGMTLEEWQKLQWWQQPYAKRVRVQVDMPWGVAGIRGTFWQNSVEGGKQSTEVLWGDAEMTAGGKTVPVTTGQHTEVTSSAQAPAPPRKIEIAEAKVWQEVGQWVVDRAVKIEQKAPVKPAPVQQLDIPVAPETATQQTSPPPPAPVIPPATTQQPGTQPGQGQPQQPVPGQTQQPATGQTQQPVPGQSSAPGTGLSGLLNSIGDALRDVGVQVETQPDTGTLFVPPPPPPPPSGGGGGGSEEPLQPTVSLQQLPADTLTSFVKLEGTVTQVSRLNELQIVLNGHLVDNIPVEPGGSFSYQLYDLELGNNQIELRAVDQQNRVQRVNRNIQWTSTYILPKAVIQPPTGSISGQADGPVNLEWTVDSQVQGTAVYHPENGIYLGLLPQAPGHETGGIPPGALHWSELDSDHELVLQSQSRLLSPQMDEPFLVRGSVAGGAEGELVEVLWYRQRQPGALANIPLNFGVIPDARVEVELDQDGNYSADLAAAGIPVQTGDMVAVLYPANEAVREAIAGPVVTGPQLIYTNMGVSAVLNEGGAGADLELRDANNQWIKTLHVQADSAGYVTVSWDQLTKTNPQGDKLLLHLEDGTQLEMPVETLQVTQPEWENGQITLSFWGEPGRPVWVIADGAEPISKIVGVTGGLDLAIPLPTAWSWQPEWQPHIKVIEQVGLGLYRGLQFDLGVVPGLELNMEESAARWWAGQGSLTLNVSETGEQETIPGINNWAALTGDYSLRQGMGLQVGADQYGSVAPLTAWLTYVTTQGSDQVGLLLRGQVEPGQQVLLEMGNGLPTMPALLRSALTVEADGSYTYDVPPGWQPDWIRVWAMGPGDYRAYRELYPWALNVNQDSGQIEGYYRQAESMLLISVTKSGGIEPFWEETIPANGGHYQTRVPGGIPAGSRIQLRNESDEVITETLATLRSAYLDVQSGELGATRLGPPGAVLVQANDSGDLWSLPASGGSYSWEYGPVISLTPSEGQVPVALLETVAPGGHRFQRQAVGLGMQVDLNQTRVEVLVNSPATTARLHWLRFGQAIWSEQVVLEAAGGGLGRAIFNLPGALQDNDRLELNSNYSVVIPAIQANIDKSDGIVNGTIMVGGEPITAGTVEVAVMTPENRFAQLIATGSEGDFSAVLPAVTGEELLEVTYITATGHRITVRLEPGEW